MMKYILIIGNVDTHQIRNVKLERYLKILSILSKNIYMLSGTCPEYYKNKIYWDKTTDFIKFRNNIIKNVINNIMTQILLIIKFYKIKKRYKIDQALFLSPYFLVILIMRFMNIRIIRYQAGSASKQSDIKGFFFRFFIEFLPSLFSNVIIVQSENCISFQNLNFFRNKILVGSIDYIDINKFCCLKPYSKRNNYFGYLGTLDKKKGVYDLLYAFLNFHQKHPTYHLLFAGDGPELDKLKKIVCKLKALEFINFLGWVPHSETPNFLNELKALILPSYTEGIPTVVLEAMSCKTPVIATPVGGIPDIIKEGETGFIINNINCISNDLENVINFTKMNVLLIKSRELIEKKFSFENCYSFFNNVIDSK